MYSFNIVAYLFWNCMTNITKRCKHSLLSYFKIFQSHPHKTVCVGGGGRREGWGTRTTNKRMEKNGFQNH